jgi:signal transduction histidine kinase
MSAVPDEKPDQIEDGSGSANALRLLSQVADATDGSEKFSESLTSTLRVICTGLNWSVGHVYIAHHERKSCDIILKSSGIWYLRDPEAHQELVLVSTLYTPDARDLPLSPQWVEDIQSDGGFARRASAKSPLNVRGAFSLPIVSGGKLIAVAEFFCTKPVKRNNAILHISAMLGLYFARIFERQEMKKLALTTRTMTIEDVYSERMVALGDMASGVAHEINNPLTIVLGHVALVTARLRKAGTVDPTIDSSLATIDTALKRIASVVYSMRQFCSNASEESFEVRSIDDLIQQSFSLCLERIYAEQVDFRMLTPPDPSIKIKTRGPQVGQILSNLLNNALDAVLALDEKWVEIRVEILDENVRVLVVDSGMGIPIGIRERIMDPFFSTKEVGHGAGMGLSTSKGMAKNHGGDVWYDEAASRTTFILQLPLISL